MPKIRKFDTYSLPEKMKILLSALILAMQEDKMERWKTDLIGIAMQYKKRHCLKREDFKLIENMTIRELVFEMTNYIM